MGWGKKIRRTKEKPHVSLFILSFIKKKKKDCESKARGHIPHVH